ncbi:immune inhibitor A domain-containing protein [Monashia sp. NPDC004114]
MRQTMHTGRSRLTGLLAAGALVAGAIVASPAQAAPSADNGASSGKNANAGNDNLRSPMAVKQDAMRQKALEKRLKGDKSAQGKVAKLGPGQYVPLEREGTDKIFVVIVEFGNEQYPGGIGTTVPPGTFLGPPKDGSATDVTGPLHNEIPAPDRAVDNSTLWQADYNKAHYENMYFTRMADYYQRQSSGRYSVEGAVTDWVKVPYNEALYGRNYCGSIVCNTSKALVRDALAVWVDNQLKSGKTMAEITAYLKTFDQQDRYDIDGDGNFNEPDGVIDHFQIVHAGGDEAAGDPHQGTDAIWSHRSFANIQGGGPLGAGVNIGSNTGTVSSPLVPNNPTGIWVGDYTMQPENGGLGVFSHEFGHDLGLPDLYDTSGNTGGAENNTAFWTLMSSGANIGDGGPDGIGDAPTDLGAWELFQLGWLQPQGKQGPFYDVAQAGKRSSHTIGSNAPATKQAQALFTLLPDKEVPLELGAPYEGEHVYYSDARDDIDTTMTKQVTLPAGSVSLSAKARYNIEQDWDYAFLRVSTDNGATWTYVNTNLSSSTDPNGQNQGHGITGVKADWTDLTADLSAWAGQTVTLQFRYWQDVAQVGQPGVSTPPPGLQLDAIAISGQPLDGAESDAGWTFDPADGSGFRASSGTVTQKFFNAYVAENRQYDGYDTSLATAYNFGFLNTTPDMVESYPYQNGLLVSYWDSSMADNNVGDHPGSGLILPVDAHPEFSHWSDGTLMRNRILSYDSTFGLEPTDAISLHNNSVAGSIASKPAVPVFDDTKSWWTNSDEHGATGSHAGRYQPGWYGVDVPKTGTTIRVVGSSMQGNSLNVLVAPK